MGFDSGNFLANMSTQSLFLIFYFFRCVYFLLIKIIEYYTGNKKVTNHARKIIRGTFYVQLIAVFMESFSSNLFAGFMGMKNTNNDKGFVL